MDKKLDNFCKIKSSIFYYEFLFFFIAVIRFDFLIKIMDATVEAIARVFSTYGEHQESLLKIYDDTVNFILEELRKLFQICPILVCYLYDFARTLQFEHSRELHVIVLHHYYSSMALN